ncbi:interleukin-15 receptor subunit alpha isoform X4 [Channa argus]|uniref:interleukin-15 receptor subunit alpha isoform X4 n=1 Tax=Channa argus TaxID=215402 RepID=UPI0035220411
MDFRSLSFSVFVVMVCLLGAARCANNDKMSCPCPKIPLRSLTKAPEENCYQVNSNYRYQCIDSYVRRAGTSNLIRCREQDGNISWSPSKLECIPDPKRTTTTTQPPMISVTTGHIESGITSTVNKMSCPCPKIPLRSLTKAPEEKCYQVNSSYRYQCVDSYVRRAGTSSLIKCQDQDGNISWSPSKLECIPDPKRTTTTTQPPMISVTSHIESSITSTVSEFCTCMNFASTSVQMSNDVSVSTPETTETSSTDQNSPGVSQVSETVTTLHTAAKTIHTTSTTADPSSSEAFNHSSSTFGNPAAMMGIASTSLVIILSLIGISLYCYKRGKKNNIPESTAEEQLPMNNVSP